MDKHILYIEDNLHNRRIVRKVLTNLGFELTEAEDGLEGFNMIKELMPPIVLLDISLPTIDGIEIAQRAKADPELQHIHLIALTASAMHGDRERFLDAGCDDYLSKPFKVTDLIEIVERHYQQIAPQESPETPAPEEPPVEEFPQEPEAVSSPPSTMLDLNKMQTTAVLKLAAAQAPEDLGPKHSKESDDSSPTQNHTENSKSHPVNNNDSPLEVEAVEHSDTEIDTGSLKKSITGLLNQDFLDPPDPDSNSS